MIRALLRRLGATVIVLALAAGLSLPPGLGSTMVADPGLVLGVGAGAPMPLGECADRGGPDALPGGGCPAVLCPGLAAIVGDGPAAPALPPPAPPALRADARCAGLSPSPDPHPPRPPQHR